MRLQPVAPMVAVQPSCVLRAWMLMPALRIVGALLLEPQASYPEPPQAYSCQEWTGWYPSNRLALVDTTAGDVPVSPFAISSVPGK
jgi:hypothetical protein